jgi:glycosyltransferase involved in cell wall biosynthesis
MISILLPIYNGIEFIDESVSSILNQTYNEWELLIGVNGHSLNSLVFKTAKQYEMKDNRIKVFDLHNIKGKVNTLNKLLEYANYNWIALIDVDDIWLPNKLKRQLHYTTSNGLSNDYDVISTNTHYFGESDNVPVLPYYDISSFNFTYYNPIINSSVLLKKELCNWDSNYEGFEDYELWLRLWKNKKTFYNFPDILVRHRIHNSSSFNTQNYEQRIEQLKKKYM